MSYIPRQLEEERNEFDQRQLQKILETIDSYRRTKVSLGILIGNLSIADLIHNSNTQWKQQIEELKMELFDIDSDIAIAYEDGKRITLTPTPQEQQKIDSLLEQITKLVVQLQKTFHEKV